MNNKLSIGIIGTGTIAKSHMKALAACAEAEVSAVADVNRDALEAFTSEFGIVQSFADYRDLLKSEPLDAVIISTPPFAHCEIAVAAAEAGKHVLCEKPMCLSVAEARQMVDAANKAGVKLAVCHGRSRAGVRAQKAKQLIDDGFLGRLYHVRVSHYRRRGRPGLDLFQDSKWFLDSSKAGGGVTYDMMCYDLDLILYLLGGASPVTVSASMFHGIDGTPARTFKFDVEEQSTVFVRFDNGISAVFEQAWASNMDRGDGVRLFGSYGGIRFDPFTLYTHRDGAEVDEQIELPDKASESFDVNFVHACLNDTKPLSTGDDGLKVMQIIEAAYQSSSTGREVVI
jgi:predicted dehydrogenase